ncbi:hypothetical protein HRG_014210 [Hirsutella rhossiliensis]
MVFLSFDESPAGSSHLLAHRTWTRPLPGMFRLTRLARVNDCVMYGVVAVTPRRGDVALVKFPEWVNVIQPIGPEDEREFFSWAQGEVLRSHVEALSGYSVRDLLSPGVDRSALTVRAEEDDGFS